MLKCIHCDDQYTNEMAFSIHKSQHAYLFDEGIVIKKPTTPIYTNPNSINKSNVLISPKIPKNIHNSFNNKSFSIEALVNSSNFSTSTSKCANKPINLTSHNSNRIDDIAAKITISNHLNHQILANKDG
jgi:hypothetical protein